LFSGVHASVSLFAFPHDNLAQTSSTMSPGNPFWGQKVKGQGHEAQKRLPEWIMALL